jgi:putative aldouronate transport system substrate-binding protein
MKKGIMILLTMILLLAACSSKKSDANEEVANEDLDNLNESGMPIVKDPIKLDIFAGKAFPDGANWNDIILWNEYEKMTNIDVTWDLIPFDSLKEKRNLAMASGSLPDAFHTSVFPNLDIYKYGEQGTFIKLNDLIDEYAPNLKKLFKEYPEIEKALTFPDGNIYSFPTIYSPDFLSLLISERPWIREDWLDDLDMDMPETTDEFYAYLQKVQKEKPDVIPYGGTSIESLVSWVKGSYGLGNRGVKYIDMDPETDKMRFYPTSDNYKEMLEYVHKLYAEKLIDQSIFTIDDAQFIANGSEGKYGSVVYHSPEDLLGGESGKYYQPAPALEGPHGDKLFTGISSSVGGTGGFLITSENPDPAATVRWMDYFYSEEGAKLFFMGIEGETFEETKDGELEYLDKITDSPDGLTLDQELTKYLTWPGGGYPGIVKEEYFKGSESSEASIKAAEKLEPNLIKETWPNFTYTAEESKELSALASDLEKYVDEMKDKFISGDAAFSEWDNYVKTIEKMGLDKYMEIQEKAYERYQNN